MALATLSIDLEAQLANLQSGLDKGARLAEKNAAQIEARYNKLASAAAGIGAAFAGALSVGALANFFRTTVDGLDALNDLADATGASVENISALENVALRTGTSLDTVATSLVKFNAELAKADKGSDTALILKQIGLDAEALRRIDPAEALRQTAVALAGFADDGNKARTVQALFGKSVKEVAPYLKDLAEQGQLNATVTADQAKAAEEFNKQLFTLQANLTAMGRAVAGPLLDALNQVGNAFRNTDQNAAGLEGTAYALAVPLQTLAVLGANLAYVFEQTGSEIGAVFAQAGQIATGSLTGFQAIRAARLQDSKQARTELDALERRLLGLDADANTKLKKLEDRGFVPGRPGLAAPAGSPKGGRSAAGKAYEGLAIDPLTLAALKRLEDSDTTKIAQLRLELQALIELRAEQGGGSVDEAILRLEEELGRLDPAQVAAAKSRERLNELLAATPTGQLRQVLADIELINDEFATGQIPVEQWAEAVAAATARLPGETAKALDDMNEFTREFQRNVQDTLGTTIRQTLAGDFNHIEQLWADMLLNLAAQAIAADIGNFLLGDKSKGGSNAGWLAAAASFMGFANGGAFAGGHVTKFADGGILNSATPFTFGGRMGVAGEAGPEGVLPLRRGRDGRLGVTAQGVGGVTNVYHIAAGVNRGELMAAMQMAAQTAESNVYRRLQSQRVMA